MMIWSAKLLKKKKKKKGGATFNLAWNLRAWTAQQWDSHMSLRKRKNTLFKAQRYSISFCQLNSTYKIICGVAVGQKSLSIIGFSIRESMIGLLPCLIRQSSQDLSPNVVPSFVLSLFFFLVFYLFIFFDMTSWSIRFPHTRSSP